MKDIIEFLDAVGEHEYAHEVANANNRLEAFSNGLAKDVMDCSIKAAGELIGINEQLRQRVAELEKERDEALRVTFNPAVLEEMNKLTAERDSAYKIADHYRAERDALKQQIDELVAAMEPFVRHNSSKSVIDLAIRTSDITKARAAIASVKEKA